MAQLRGARLLGVVIAVTLVASLGTSRSVAAAAGTSGTSGTVATRADAAQRHLVDRYGRRLDGRGVTIAVIDTGIDPTHPAFLLPDGRSKVVRSLTAVPCVPAQATSEYLNCVTDVPTSANSDAGAGGHGTFVGGVAVGNRFTLPDGTHVGGNAPGARLVMISATAALQGIDQAFAWVLAHHKRPCGSGVSRRACPPIKVLSLSWGDNDPIIAGLERQLVAQGVVVVWANGNTGGNGSTSSSNDVPAADSTPGILTIAGYDDLGTGTRNGKIDPESSRGAKAHPRTWPDISAPAVNVVSACRTYQAECVAVTHDPQDGPAAGDVATYSTGSGTSWAAPAVAGIVALLFQADPTATPKQIDAALKSTAYKYRSGAKYVRDGRFTSSYDKGAGLVDAYAAARALGARRR
ncbi:MAG TPA: S8 family serine peptidase [Mycobacteriales bacterium]|nr:S8 family serine peptidase [Mycobacteriales bacterium]